MLDRVSQFALVAAAQALAQSTGALDGARPQRAGVFVGTGMGGSETSDDGYHTLYARGLRSREALQRADGDEQCAGRVDRPRPRARGPEPHLLDRVLVLDRGHRRGRAAHRRGRGRRDDRGRRRGAAHLRHAQGVGGAARRLRPRMPSDPAASCKPFAKDRSGLVLGEGAAMVVLEDCERARARGAQILARIVGYGLTTDASHITRPSVAGQARAMRLALEDAALDARRDRLHQRPRHRHAGQRSAWRPRPSRKSSASARAAIAGELDQVDARPSAGGRRGARARGGDPRARARRCCRRPRTCGCPIPSATSTTCPTRARRVERLTAVMSNSFAFGGTNAVLVARAD